MISGLEDDSEAAVFDELSLAEYEYKWDLIGCHRIQKIGVTAVCVKARESFTLLLSILSVCGAMKAEMRVKCVHGPPSFAQYTYTCLLVCEGK